MVEEFQQHAAVLRLHLHRLPMDLGLHQQPHAAEWDGNAIVAVDMWLAISEADCDAEMILPRRQVEQSDILVDRATEMVDELTCEFRAGLALTKRVGGGAGSVRRGVPAAAVPRRPASRA